MTSQIKISGMNCQHCVGAVTRALQGVQGVSGVQVDLASGLAQVEGTASAGELVRAVVEAGYGAEVAGAG